MEIGDSTRDSICVLDFILLMIELVTGRMNLLSYSKRINSSGLLYTLTIFSLLDAYLANLQYGILIFPLIFSPAAAVPWFSCVPLAVFDSVWVATGAFLLSSGLFSNSDFFFFSPFDLLRRREWLW